MYLSTRVLFLHFSCNTYESNLCLKRIYLKKQHFFRCCRSVALHTQSWSVHTADLSFSRRGETCSNVLTLDLILFIFCGLNPYFCSSTVKRIQSARNVRRTSNSLERWVVNRIPAAASEPVVLEPLVPFLCLLFFLVNLLKMPQINSIMEGTTQFVGKTPDV